MIEICKLKSLQKIVLPLCKGCEPLLEPTWVLGTWGEGLFIFRELWSIGNYFQGSGEQAHSFGDLGSPAKKSNINLNKKFHRNVTNAPKGIGLALDTFEES